MLKKIFSSVSKVNNKPKKESKPANKRKNMINKPVSSTSNKPVPKPRPRRKPPLTEPKEKQLNVPTNASVASKNRKVNRKFTYTEPITLKRKTDVVKDVEVETISDERLLSKRPILETVNDLNDISFFQKINLVNYFNQIESGKIDERIAKEEYRRNSEQLRNETSLLHFLRESARRNLEHNEIKGYRFIDIRIDPQYSLEAIQKCTESKLLASYNIEVIHNNDLLSKMGVDPIVVRMSLKKM